MRDWMIGVGVLVLAGSVSACSGSDGSVVGSGDEVDAGHNEAAVGDPAPDGGDADAAADTGIAPYCPDAGAYEAGSTVAVDGCFEVALCHSTCDSKLIACPDVAPTPEMPQPPTPVPAARACVPWSPSISTYTMGGFEQANDAGAQVFYTLSCCVPE